MKQSRLEQFVLESRKRLQRIRTSTGENFATDAGDSVFLGAIPSLGPDDNREAIAIGLSFERGKVIGDFISLTVILGIQALVYVPSELLLSDSFLRAMQILSDIRRAMETEDRTMGGLIEGHGLEYDIPSVVDRETGSQFVGVQMDYRAGIKECWGNP